MENKKTIVAIELGSSKISGAAARRNEDGVLEVLAYEKKKKRRSSVYR